LSLYLTHTRESRKVQVNLRFFVPKSVDNCKLHRQQNQSSLNQYWRYAYWSFSVAYILSSWMTSYSMSWLIKILPVATLIIVAIKIQPCKISKLFITGLIFSLIGDFILDYYQTQGFIFGLAAFFIAHLFYIFSLGKWSISSKMTIVSLLVITYGSIVCYLIYPQLANLKIPVLAYMLILLVMCLSCLFSVRTNVWLLLGGLSFVVSDSIIGLNKFYSEIPLSGTLIMSSYYLAQYSLLRGFFKIFETTNTSQKKGII